MPPKKMVAQQIIFPLLILVAGVMGGPGQPNVLLIIVDDLRPALGCYDDPLAFTPYIDALASQGTVFTRAYAQQALCGPSRTSFLTSRRPDTTRLYDVHSYWRSHAGNFTSLPQYFKEHGYHTAAAGKVFHPGIVSNHSDDQPYSWSEAPFHPPSQAHKQDPVCLGSDGALHTNIYCPVQVADQPGGSLPDIETTRYSTAWLQARAEATRLDQTPNQPFFLAVGYHKPHIPLKFPRDFLELFPIASVPLAPNRWLPKGLPPVAWNPWNDLRWREDIAALNVTFPYGPMPDYYARYIRQGYYAATSYTDSLIGDLLATVDKLFPDTIVALIGDHGWSLGEHQEWSKFSNFEVSTRVPFIIRDWRRRRRTNTTHVPLKEATGSTMEGQYSGLVELVDLFPTLVDLAGLPTLDQCPSDSHKVRVCTEGVSLSRIVKRDSNEEGIKMRGVYKVMEAKRMFSAKRRVDNEVNSDDWSLNMKGRAGYKMDKDERKVDIPKLPLMIEEKEELFGIRKNKSKKPTKESTMPLLAYETKTQEQKFVKKKKEAKQSTQRSKVLKNVLLENKLEKRGIQPREKPEIPLKIPKKELEKREAWHSVADSDLLLLLPEKRAAFSQYPRPGPTPSRNPDSDQPHTKDTTIMGYSVRTNRFRYTAWLRFDNVTYRPDWNNIVAEELYDHKIDPSEDHNVVGKSSYAQRRQDLYSVLHGGWRSAVRWR